MRISDWSSDVCSSDLGNHWVITAMPSRRWSKRRPDASLLPGLPIAHAEGRKKPVFTYTWPRSLLVSGTIRTDSIGISNCLCHLFAHLFLFCSSWPPSPVLEIGKASFRDIVYPY